MQLAAIKHTVATTLADLRSSLHHLRRAPLLAALTILTLGIGIDASSVFVGRSARVLKPLRDW
jgi:hypothetical protein